MTDTVERFSNRAQNYVKYRPGYPPEMMAHFRDELGLTSEWKVADIGSGTGLSTLPFLEAGCTVYGVEPNAAMREAAEEFLSGQKRFVSVDGSSTATTLGDASMDMVVAAQAFHWFEPGPTRAEFERILKPDGWAALIWNERQLDTTDFLREYEQLLLKYGRDYEKVRHENVDAERLEAFFGKRPEEAKFLNVQEFGFEGLRGRLLSASYMPDESDAMYEAMMHELGALFAKHAESGKIKVFYDTKVFYCQL